MEHNIKMVFSPKKGLVKEQDLDDEAERNEGKRSIDDEKAEEKNSSSKLDPTSTLIERLENLVKQVEKNNRLLYANTLIKEFKVNRAASKRQIKATKTSPRKKKAAQFKWKTL